MVKRKIVLVLVHGAWGSVWIWRRVLGPRHYDAARLTIGQWPALWVQHLLALA